MSKYYANDKPRACDKSRGVQKIFVNPNYMRVSNVQNPQNTIHLNPRFKTELYPRFPNTYINPLFKNAHINPHFIKDGSASTNIVHINPNVSNQLFANNKCHNNTAEKPCIKSEIIIPNPKNVSKYSYISNHKLIKEPNVATEAKTEIKKCYLKKTRNKLIRLPLNNIKQQNISKNLNKPSVFSHKSFSRSSKFTLKCSTKPLKLKSALIYTQYKLDRRLTNPELNKRRIRTRYTVRPAHNSHKSQIVNIDLPSTRNKFNKSISRTVGVKYLVQKNGKTLRRITINEEGTKVPKSLSFRTISYANKDKRLVRITKLSKNREKLRLNNVSCLVYRRFGFCKRHELGRCFKVHDRKLVDICKEFLSGKCTSDKCKLSHEVSAAKMPICLHYLSGTCGRDNCPYPHIKHSLDVPVCKQFLRGYCEKAEKCEQRHVFIYPDLDKTRSRIKLNHTHGVTKSKPKIKMVKKLKPKKEITDLVPNKSRYYVEVENSAENIEIISGISEETQKEVSMDEIDTKFNNKRPVLGILPSYIPI